MIDSYLLKRFRKNKLIVLFFFSLMATKSDDDFYLAYNLEIGSN